MALFKKLLSIIEGSEKNAIEYGKWWWGESKALFATNAMMQAPAFTSCLCSIDFKKELT